MAIPPPVPPRPDKDLLRERLLNIEAKKNATTEESLDEKRETW